LDKEEPNEEIDNERGQVVPKMNFKFYNAPMEINLKNYQQILSDIGQSSGSKKMVITLVLPQSPFWHRGRITEL